MNTPLHIAIQNGNIEIIKSLLADGCDVHARNNEGLTPLDLATTLNSEEIVHLLLEHGAGHLPPQPAYSTASVLFTPEQRKKRITFWTIACTIVLLALTLSPVLHNAPIPANVEYKSFGSQWHFCTSFSSLRALLLISLLTIFTFFDYGKKCRGNLREIRRK
jgi:hypothetical protein